MYVKNTTLIFYISSKCSHDFVYSNLHLEKKNLNQTLINLMYVGYNSLQQNY